MKTKTEGKHTNMKKDCEFPCLNPNHNTDDYPDLMRNVVKAWIDGNERVRVTCPRCQEHNEPGFRDLWKPPTHMLAIMLEYLSHVEGK